MPLIPGAGRVVRDGTHELKGWRLNWKPDLRRHVRFKRFSAHGSAQLRVDSFTRVFPAHPGSFLHTPVLFCTPRFFPVHPGSFLHTPVLSCTPRFFPAHPCSFLHTPTLSYTPRFFLTCRNGVYSSSMNAKETCSSVMVITLKSTCRLCVLRVCRCCRHPREERFTLRMRANLVAPWRPVGRFGRSVAVSTNVHCAPIARRVVRGTSQDHNEWRSYCSYGCLWHCSGNFGYHPQENSGSDEPL